MKDIFCFVYYYHLKNFQCYIYFLILCTLCSEFAHCLRQSVCWLLILKSNAFFILFIHTDIKQDISNHVLTEKVQNLLKQSRKRM